jgi:probable rRNA maturation factor
MSSADIPLLFHTRRKLRKAPLRRFLLALSRNVVRGKVIHCLITNDAALRRFNRDFLGKDHPTDVLSFPAASGNGIAGDLAISIDRAKAQAAEHGHSVEDELKILMLHGALHLAGMDHENDSGQMARAEARWRKRLGLPGSLIERASTGRVSR